MGIADGLRRLRCGKVIDSKDGLVKYMSDRSSSKGDMPIAAICPGSTRDVSRIMAFCYKNKMGVTVRGGGTSLTGSSIPKGKSIVIDMARMNRILETNIEDRYVVVEPGVFLDKLDKHLSRYKYFYPPDPASSGIAKVGGTINTNAGGLRAVSYGTTKNWVLGLEVVLPSGEVIRSGGKVLKRSLGYDITGLLIASEGTLGVVTKATLEIWPKPEAIDMIVSYYSNVLDAGRAIGAMKKQGITPYTAEFIDRYSMDLMREAHGIKFPEAAAYAVFIQLASQKESLARLTGSARRILKKHAIEVETTNRPGTMVRLYRARKDLYTTMVDKERKEGREVLIADIVVPVSKIPKTLVEMRREAKRSRLEVALFGHIEDGNIHANIACRPSSASETRRVDRLQETFGRIAIRNGGSVSAEHGIGISKKKLLKEELEAHGSLGTLRLMKGIKSVFDPKGILNKGKIFD